MAKRMLLPKSLAAWGTPEFFKATLACELLRGWRLLPFANTRKYGAIVGDVTMVVDDADDGEPDGKIRALATAFLQISRAGAAIDCRADMVLTIDRRTAIAEISLEGFGAVEDAE